MVFVSHPLLKIVNLRRTRAILFRKFTIFSGGKGFSNKNVGAGEDGSLAVEFDGATHVIPRAWVEEKVLPTP